MHFSISAVALTFLIVKIVQVLHKVYGANLRKVPGPWLNKVSTFPLKFRIITGQRTKYIHGLHNFYGPVVRVAPNEVAVADIKAFREIHKIGTSFIKAPWYQTLSPLQHNDETSGVFSIRDSRKAIARRRLFQQAGTKAAVLQFEPTVHDLVKATIHKIKRDAEKGVADVEKWWALMTADVLGSLAFGEPFNMIENEKKTQMIEDIEISMALAGMRQELPWIWALIERIPFPKIGKPKAFFDRFNEYGETAVRNTKAASKASAKTLFSKMIPEEGEQPLSDAVIAQESGNIIIAGSDTTAMVLTYLTYSVLKNPDVKEKLLAELAGCSPNLTWEELEQLPYLNNVIQETLRLYAPVPASLPRTAPVGGVVFAGYHIPGGVTCDTQAYTYHRDPTVWKEPERFNPDRWIDPTAEMKEHFMPFGGSARICLGQNVARLEILLSIATLFRELPDAKLADSVTEESMDFIDFFVMKPAGGKLEITAK